MYKNLQPKEESLTFIPPNFELLQDIRNQGEIVINCRNNGGYHQSPIPNGSNLAQSLSSSSSNLLHRQSTRVVNSPNNGGDQLLWDSTTENASATGNNASCHVTSTKTYASIVKPAVTITGQCIPGSTSHVSVKPALAPSKFERLRQKVDNQDHK